MSLKLLSFLAFLSGALAQTVPVDCLTRNPPISSLEDLASCFETYTVPQNYYTCSTYASAQPTPAELEAWNAAVSYILSTPRASCGLPTNSPLSSIYNATLFVDGTTRGSSCVLYEKNAVPTSGGNVFQRGWGTLIVQPNFVRPLHFSIPHPLADAGVTPQAAIVFKRVVGKSLLMEGRHPLAVSGSECASTCTGATADGTHNTVEPFHQALLQIRAWQNVQEGGCPSQSCAYLQWSGKPSGACSSDSTFLSSGIATASCYTSPTLPLNRIQSNLSQAFPSGTHSTPATASCSTDTDDIFARVVNGVPEADVCTVAPAGCGGPDFGQFVRIEQDEASRDPGNWGRWSNVVSLAFSA